MSTVIHHHPHLIRFPPPPSPPSPVFSLSTQKPQLSLSTHKSQLANSSKPKFLSTNLLTACEPSDSNPSETDKIGFLVDGFFYLLRLSAQYRDEELVRTVHASVLKLQEDNIYLNNALISAYIKLGLLRDAFYVFLGLSSPTVVSYTALISGFAKSNREIEAMKLFFKMRRDDIDPNEYSFVAILTACMRLSQLQFGIQIHALAIKLGFIDCVFVANALLGLYGNHSECLDYAVKLFDEMPQRDTASWNTVMSSLVKDLRFDAAFSMFSKLNQTSGVKSDQFTISTLLSACTGKNDLLRGREIHGCAIRIGLMEDLSVNNALIKLYTESGDMKDVVTLFEKMPVKDVITWTEMITAYMEQGMVAMALEMFGKIPDKNIVSYNALLAGFCRNGLGSNAMELFVEMVQKGLDLTDFSLTSAVSACGLVMDNKLSKQIHGFCVKIGFESNAYIKTALLDMCTKCGRMTDAEKMFNRWDLDRDESRVRTSMFCGYARDALPEKALFFFLQILSEGDLVLDEVSLTSLLAVCGNLGFQETGVQVHCHALKTGFLSEVGVCNSLINMYSRCSKMDSAIRVFDEMQEHDVVSWNSLITGHVLHRQGDEALALWSRMIKAGIKPDPVTLVLVISAHKYTMSNSVSTVRDLFLSMRTDYGIEPTMDHYSSYIGVLGHWGYLEEAEETVNSMPFETECSVFRSLLHSCRIHKNTTLGKRIVKRILSMEPTDPSSYILKSNLYSASGLWHISDSIRDRMRENGFTKVPARSWIIQDNKVHSFYTRDRSHVQQQDIYSGLEVLIMECMKAGYKPDTSYVLQEVEEYQKQSFLFCHSAKLAATYGILNSSHGRAVRVMKNIMLCGDCHEFFKCVSVVTKREIVVRDSSGFHSFVDGQCSCRDLW